MIWKPDTCNCIIEYDDNGQNLVFIEQCITHNTPAQTVAHNQGFNTRHGTSPTPPQQAQQGIDKTLEKKKPQFQRR